VIRSEMSKIPTSASRLAQPGTQSKRPREGSLDLESGLTAKKSRSDAGPSTNLTKSKSKSMMSIAGAGRVTKPIPGGPTGRPSLAPSRSKVGQRTDPAAARRQTTTALNDRTNTTTSRLTREKTGINRTGVNNTTSSSTAGKKKIPAWDTKARLEEMEKLVTMTNDRMNKLESEKAHVEADLDVKKEVVQQSSEQIKTMRDNMEESERELEVIRKSLQEKENNFTEENTKLRRKLDDEEYAKNSLERKLKGLEDELNSKMTEISGLKNSVAELSSSRAGIEASLAGAKTELEAARNQITDLLNECKSKAEEIKASLELQEEMKGKMIWGETERRRLHNMVQELKGNIRVFCRMRPLLGEEKESGNESRHVNISSEKNMELTKFADGGTKNSKYDFEFDKVFGPSSNQGEVYDEISQLVQSALDGYNVCVFAYGQTGSGKTYTMEGGPGIEEDMEQCGVIPRTIRQIFEMKKQLVEKSWKYKLHASFLEIYNEEIKDLLQNDSTLKHEIKMSNGKGTDIHVTNLREEEVLSEDQIETIIKKARKNRAWAKTLANERSSRSHSVFMLRIEGFNSATSESCCGTLNLVDLAGSERVKDSGSEGLRLTEAQNINKSLSNLGNVIMALAQKNSHVPYRNSKLTHLLQNCLGGNSKTLMFVNISPREEHINETLNSLRFATKVNNCNIGTATAKKNVK